MAIVSDDVRRLSQARYVEDIEASLRSVARMLKKRGRDILTGFDITPPQFDALLFLREGGEMTMGELCQKMFLACSTATDLIDRMERNGLIERVRDSADRRVIRLRVLDKGYEIIENVMEARREYLASVLEQVDEGEQRELSKALKKLHNLMYQDE